MGYGLPRKLSTNAPTDETLLLWVKQELVPVVLSLRTVLAKLTKDIDDGAFTLGDPVTVRLVDGTPTEADNNGSVALSPNGLYVRVAGSWVLLGSGGGTIEIVDEGVPKGAAEEINFVGAGVTATVTDGAARVEIPGGAGTPAGSVVTETSFGQASAVGVSTDYARADHTHGTPSAPSVPSAATTVVTETSFGQASAVGVATTYAREDHTHGTPAAPAGGGTFLGATVDFGTASPTPDSVTATIADAGVAADSKILASVRPAAGRDIDEMELGPVKVGYGNIVAGVSFDVIVASDDGTAHGQYTVDCTRN